MVRSMLTRCFAATALLAAAVQPQNAWAQGQKDINFGIIATEASTNLKAIWQPFLESMAKATGLKVNGFYASDYAGVIEAMRFGKVQVA